MAKKILSHPIIGLDNWRPMAIFFYCSRKNNSSQMTKDVIFSKKDLDFMTFNSCHALDKICNNRKMKN